MNNRMKWSVAVVAAVVALLTTAAVSADWMVFYLQPEGSPGSGGNATFQGQHVGYVRVGATSCYDATPHAALWGGMSTEWIDLHPAGAQYSGAHAIDNGQQAGIVRYVGDTFFHAALWSGSADSFVDLHPGGEQAGLARISSPSQAAIWRGSAASYVSLHPAGQEVSIATDTNGVRQVGRTRVSQVYGDSHAALWSGSAESWVDLHPSDAAADSGAQAISPDGSEQVGFVRVQVDTFIDYHAAIWHGLADEWIDLNPPDAIFSTARDTDGTYQVGQAYVGESAPFYTYRAYVWKGSVETQVDLHALLPSQYTMSEAEGVYSDGSGVWVFGYAHRTGVQCDQAILWYRPTPCPWDCQPAPNGEVDVSDFLAMLASWGDMGVPCDFDGGGVGVTDFLILLANWGPCP
jgi:hypothetical protein